jgi:hypothetical protein
LARDPFLRSWVKVPTTLLDQPKYRRLTFGQFGIFVLAMLYSTRSSDVIGYFLVRGTGERMTLEDIGDGILPTRGDRERLRDEVDVAFRAFVQCELILHDDANGYFVEPSVFEQFLHENNLESKRKADATRQRAKRDRDRKAASGDGSGPRLVEFRRDE